MVEMPRNANGQHQQVAPQPPELLSNGLEEHLEETPSNNEETVNKEAAGSRPDCMMTILIRLTSDPRKDRKRLEKLKNELTQYPGKDRFRFVLDDSVNSQKIYTLEFPYEHTSFDGQVKQLLEDKIKKSIIQSYQTEPLTQNSDQD